MRKRCPSHEAMLEARRNAKTSAGNKALYRLGGKRLRAVKLGREPLIPRLPELAHCPLRSPATSRHLPGVTIRST